MIELFRLQHVAHALAGTLSYGQQKLIDIAMAFMATPRLVLLDEPARASTRASSTSCASFWSSSTRRRAEASSSSSTTWTS
jgi:ABC-type branched-subunit amino acid transport system ATPase component